MERALVALLLSQLKRATLLATSIEQLCNAAQHTVMSMSQTPLNEHQHITPPSSFIDAPLTPPPTDKKAFMQASRVIALFKDIQCDEVERRHKRDESLLGYAKGKILYDYDGRSHRLVIRMPTGVHELFIDGVEDAIRCQLKTIRGGSDKATLFEQKSTTLRLTQSQNKTIGGGWSLKKCWGWKRRESHKAMESRTGTWSRMGGAESDSDGDGELDSDAESKGVGESGEDDETGEKEESGEARELGRRDGPCGRGGKSAAIG
ncbi:hypothetical protein FGG08_003169 [Glutinoglossum americanum]|uniref:Uncharacterized protein n=1 Tax=Glutinoglossum americanum TaxID=1670608 RepID=A0A9P8I387_9PEZI|nr:hypothetical protein FGG08_003169 [Glutinoglossum americanum]